MFWKTASAVPRYQSELSRPRYGCRSVTPPPCRSRSHGRPIPIWSFSERGRYCVSTPKRSTPELTQLLSANSMIRCAQPEWTLTDARLLSVDVEAGHSVVDLERDASEVSGDDRSSFP